MIQQLLFSTYYSETLKCSVYCNRHTDDPKVSKMRNWYKRPIDGNVLLFAIYFTYLIFFIIADFVV